MNTYTQNSTLKWLLVLLVVLAVGYFGYSGGYKSGYAQAQADIKTSQDALARQATEQAATAANHFKATSNPLSGVADPLAKTKSILNPFSK